MGCRAGMIILGIWVNGFTFWLQIENLGFNSSVSLIHIKISPVRFADFFSSALLIFSLKKKKKEKKTFFFMGMIIAQKNFVRRSLYTKGFKIFINFYLILYHRYKILGALIKSSTKSMTLFQRSDRGAPYLLEMLLSNV